jgi:hypothetical protein
MDSMETEHELCARVRQALPLGVRAGYTAAETESRLQELRDACLALLWWERDYRELPEAERELWDGTDEDLASLCIVKLKQRVHLALEKVRDMAAAAEALPASDSPHWDGERRELRFNGAVCKTYRQPAPHQERILQEFEDLAWPSKIEDPLPGGCDNASERLTNAIRGLNNNPAILFERDGTTEGILWRPKPT